MKDRRIDGFFYGLFMDSEVLRKRKIRAVNPRRAYVDDYALRIGQRSTLIPDIGARVYGMVFALTHEDLDRLYSAPGLEHYQPEAVLAHSLEGESYPALCYNLQDVPKPAEANEEYAARLREALERLDFPLEYIATIL